MRVISDDPGVFEGSLTDLERRLVFAQGLLVHPDDRLFARAAVPAESPAAGSV